MNSVLVKDAVPWVIADAEVQVAQQRAADLLVAAAKRMSTPMKRKKPDSLLASSKKRRCPAPPRTRRLATVDAVMGNEESSDGGASGADVESEGELAWREFKDTNNKKSKTHDDGDDNGDGTEDDEDDDDDKPLASLIPPKVKANTRSATGSAVAMVVPAPAPPPPPAPPLPPPAPPAASFASSRTRLAGVGMAPPGSRAVEVDGVIFHELWPKNVFSGISQQCRYHDDCARDLAFGRHNPMTPAEARFRLLAWETAGANISKDRHSDLGRPMCLRTFASEL